MSFSPKRLHLFSSKLQETGGVTLKPLCPTRWTARIPATEAFLTDYTLLLETFGGSTFYPLDEYGLKAFVGKIQHLIWTSI